MGIGGACLCWGRQRVDGRFLCSVGGYSVGLQLDWFVALDTKPRVSCLYNCGGRRFEQWYGVGGRVLTSEAVAEGGGEDAGYGLLDRVNRVVCRSMG